MPEKKRNLPIGVQSFEKIINNSNLYVDKTEYVYRLVHTSTPYFLNRPRRFGKSLFLSTLKAYWEGKKELFKGLRIEELEQDEPESWESYPVFYFDFNKADYADRGALEAVLEDSFREWEGIYGKTQADAPFGIRFGQLLESAYQMTRKGCVVLVDEYDKPLLDPLEDINLVERNKAVFKGVFSVLKSKDEIIQFVFITGVTKFSKVSIFSDMNQLRDISMSMDYAAICGITEQEMKDTFRPEIETLAREYDLTYEECLQKLKQEYDGYHFHPKGEGVYNPFSLLNAMADRQFGSYWYETGTPSFLVKRIKSIGFDVRRFTDGTLYATMQMLKDYRNDDPDPVPLLYQTGYLTLMGYDTQKAVYTLGFPNREVEYGFLGNLLPIYAGNVGSGSGKDILSLAKYVEVGDLVSIRNVLTALFAGIPYPTNADPFEHDFQSVLYITLTLLGQYVHCEQHTSFGRLDCILETKGFIYIFEFKRDASAKTALKQIRDMHYADPYVADTRKLYKIGVNFDSKSRQLTQWEVEEEGSRGNA